MTAKIIDGKAIADELRKEIAKGVEDLLEAGGTRPGLATVLVGENPASQTYVRMKGKACEEVGIEFSTRKLGANRTGAKGYGG